MSTLTMDARRFVLNLKAALLSTSCDASRPHLHNVRLELHAEPACVRFVATDGHRLWLNEEPAELAGRWAAWDPPVASIDREDVVRLVKGVSVKKGCLPVVVALATGRVTITQGTTTIGAFSPVVVRFPPYAQIVPPCVASDSRRVRPSVDATYLSDVARSFALLSESRAQDVTMTPGEGLADPIYFVSESAPRALAVLMPMRTRDKDTQRVANESALLALYRVEAKAPSDALRRDDLAQAAE
jgi:hypothetical protein